MQTLTLTKEDQPHKADWLVFSEAVLRVGHLTSLDELLHAALESWLQQLSPELRWKIACDLYSSEQISSGRAAEIAGLNYFVFEEKLRQNAIDFKAAHSTTETQKEKRKALIHAGFKLLRYDLSVLDTNVLSKLAQANKLDLLHQLTTVPLYITPHIQRELEVGLRHGVSYLLKALELLNTGELQLITPTPAESGGIKKWPSKLGLGEIEALSLCRKRNLVFISHDTRAIKYGEWLGIGCIPLTDLLEEFVNMGWLTTSEMEHILK